MNSEYFGELSIVGMKGTEKFLSNVDWYLKQWRKDEERETFLVDADCPRFGTGEAKGIIHETMRGHDTYIFVDPFNYSVKYNMYGMQVPMSPDDHFQDLKRIICAIFSNKIVIFDFSINKIHLWITNKTSYEHIFWFIV